MRTLTKRWRSHLSSSVSTKPDILLPPGTIFLLTVSQARLLSWQRTEGWWLLWGQWCRQYRWHGSIRQFLEASDNFCVRRRQQRGSDTRSWPALHGQVALSLYLSHFLCFGVFWCIFVFGIKQWTWSGRLCWRISWTTSSTCFAMRLAAICVR